MTRLPLEVNDRSAMTWTLGELAAAVRFLRDRFDDSLPVCCYSSTGVVPIQAFGAGGDNAAAPEWLAFVGTELPYGVALIAQKMLSIPDDATEGR